MENAYHFSPAPLDLAKRTAELVGYKRPELKELQFWYTASGELVMTLTVPENQSEFAAVQVVEVRRAIIELYGRRDFDRFTYAPMILAAL